MEILFFALEKVGQKKDWERRAEMCAQIIDKNSIENCTFGFMKRKVLLIYTGGTIGMEKDYETGSLQAFDFGNIFKKLPEMKLIECEVSVHPFKKPLDSSDMGPEEWKIIANYIGKNYDKYDGFLILHGTDTMSYTA